MQRWTQYLIPTLKEVPQDAEIPSHQLMLRAGLIRRLGSGLYTFLPLGLRALRKVERIVREEMDRAGALEVLMPAMQPADIWEKSGRLESMNEVMFHVNDRAGRHNVLGPTHEEVITDLAVREVSSYKQLPLNFYQIQTKFRDEIRPRFGLMRCREFIMKDAYSFDADLDGIDTTYRAMYDAYTRIFARCGLESRVVEADTGAIGGSSSHEFMVVAEAGEDGIVECPECNYAANLEKAEGRFAVPAGAAADSPEEVATPGRKTIAEVAGFLKLPESDLVKTLVYEVEGGDPIMVLVPGDRDVHELKLDHMLGDPGLRLASDAVVRERTGSEPGYLGPVGVKNLTVIADRSLEGVSGLVVGANQTDAHLRGVDLARDVEAGIRYADVVFARAGDGCPRCDGTLRECRGIEVGHVFKLGTKYSEAMGAMFLDANGKQQPLIMGCYGIGVTRTLQAAIEQSHDDNGIIWPAALAPFDVELLVLNTKDEASMQAAGELGTALEALGLEVLFDDRKERPGFKFKDADLVGLPVRVAIGERSLADGVVEVKLRTSEEVHKVPVAEAAGRVKELLGSLTGEAAHD